MCKGSSTKGDNFHKDVGLDWLTELPEHGTLTKQEIKSEDNVYPCFYLQFIASVSTLSSQCDKLCSDRTIHNNC